MGSLRGWGGREGKKRGRRKEEGGEMRREEEGGFRGRQRREEGGGGRGGGGGRYICEAVVHSATVNLTERGEEGGGWNRRRSLLRPTVFLAGHQEPLVLLGYLLLQSLNSHTLLCRLLPQVTIVTLCEGECGQCDGVYSGRGGSTF